MPASKTDKVQVPCPHCGSLQSEPRTAFSTICKKCGKHFRLEEVTKPGAKTRKAAPAAAVEQKKHVTCFECGAELEVALTAESTMCKKCSRYVDLKDYLITSAVSKNFKTKGSFTVETTGYVFNTEVLVADAVIKGRFLGKLNALNSLTLYSTAEIKGTFKVGKLIIPAGNHFRWKEDIRLHSADIAGELVVNLNAEGTVTLRSTARMFGDITAQGLVVESGAVVLGNMKTGLPQKKEDAPSPARKGGQVALI
jgi:cytoskeletal protein CcmA (bactofilin family)/DNA-directed RNA polymerase subunit RPC12/RpoP